MTAIDLEAFRNTELVRDPYEYVVVSDFLKPGALDAINSDYPKLKRHGSYPVSEVDHGPSFTALLDELASGPVARAFAEKFEIDLTDRPTMVTVRGHCHAKDGRIHPDSEDKLITVLIYLNTDWENPNGRLRILRSKNDIEDYAAEVPPQAGTLLAFRRSDRSFHGHTTYVGERRVIQLNWVLDDNVVRREQARHRRSARIKKWLPFT
ncbi:MAG: 2OG-Fe(II) oxygenase [Rhodospirillales bacterium]|nr:2OG-Fe(II) oxygenase [Rhodospirillales bacterium]